MRRSIRYKINSESLGLIRSIVSLELVQILIEKDGLFIHDDGVEVYNSVPFKPVILVFEKREQRIFIEIHMIGGENEVYYDITGFAFKKGVLPSNFQDTSSELMNQFISSSYHEIPISKSVSSVGILENELETFEQFTNNPLHINVDSAIVFHHKTDVTVISLSYNCLYVYPNMNVSVSEFLEAYLEPIKGLDKTSFSYRQISYS